MEIQECKGNMTKNGDVSGRNIENGNVTSIMKQQSKMKIHILWLNEIIKAIWMLERNFKNLIQGTQSLIKNTVYSAKPQRMKEENQLILLKKTILIII